MSQESGDTAQKLPPSQPRGMRLLVLAVLLVRTPSPEMCKALNVSVSPGPKVQYMVGDNATLFCHVSQKRHPETLLAVRWVFVLPSMTECLMVKMTKYGVVQYYGNYTHHVYRQKLRLLEERHRTLYTFLILNLQQSDQGHYICKVQEIGKHRNKWAAWSNGSASTEIQVVSPQISDETSTEKSHKVWKFFEDLYVMAVFVCSIGIITLLLFTLVIFCQTLINRKHSHVKHYLVKYSQNSLGETVTSVTSLSTVQPIKIRKKKKLEQPPAVPAKAPRSNTFNNPRLLKPTRKVLLDLDWTMNQLDFPCHSLKKQDYRRMRVCPTAHTIYLAAAGVLHGHLVVGGEERVARKCRLLLHYPDAHGPLEAWKDGVFFVYPPLPSH